MSFLRKLGFGADFRRTCKYYIKFANILCRDSKLLNHYESWTKNKFVVICKLSHVLWWLNKPKPSSEKEIICPIVERCIKTRNEEKGSSSEYFLPLARKAGVSRAQQLRPSPRVTIPPVTVTIIILANGKIGGINVNQS